ncbi:MAG: NAD(P)-dependent oxidoreductase [Firmicutes bacterium]|nr:NAD(P)-dependent oxidoreductase [Bacillota bacterium]
MAIPVDQPPQFAEVVPPLTPREAEEEALRCYYCYDAPCIKACPTNIDIPRFIHHIVTGDLKASARTILDANILGATCARICPTEALCEGHCVRTHDSRPVSIGRLQRVAMDYAMTQGVPALPPRPRHGSGRVAIVGAGPAGLGAAAELLRAGYQVEIFDRREEGGGLDTYGIVSYREPVAVSLFEVNMVRQLGAKMHLGETVDAPRIRALQRDFDAVIVAVGLGKVPRLAIPGEDLAGVYDALDFIEATKVGDFGAFPVGERVAVIGAGNTAVDAATCAKRLGASEVTIFYRRGEEAMSAYRYEYEFAKQDGIRYQWWAQPVAILGTQRVNAVRFSRTRVDGPVTSRSAPVQLVEGSEWTVPVDTVIRAVGQEKTLELWSALGCRVADGRVVVDPETYETSVAGIFAVGDCLARPGEATVVQAVEDGKRAARAIDRMLSEKSAR